MIIYVDLNEKYVDKYICHELYCDTCELRFKCFTEPWRTVINGDTGFVIDESEWDNFKKKHPKKIGILGVRHVHYCCRLIKDKRFHSQVV